MSAIIQQFIVHRLGLNDAQQLAVIPRSACFEATSPIEQLVEQLHQVYAAKPGKGVGGLHLAEQPEVDNLLDQLDDSDDSFYTVSVALAERLKTTLVEFGTVEVGYLVISRYQFLATDYLFIGLLGTKQHVEINHSMELNYSDHLDLTRMQLAARIDLTERRINRDANRYVSFIKGRAGRKVADFFLAFLQCDEQVDVKQQNKQLVNTVDAFFQAEQLDPEEKQQGRQQMAEYYKTKLEQGSDVSLSELAEQLPQGNGRFDDFARQAEQPLEEQFQADPSVIRSLSKFSGAGGGVTISFERKLLGDKVQYDPHSDTLLIKGIPPNLKDQLLKSGQ